MVFAIPHFDAPIYIVVCLLFSITPAMQLLSLPSAFPPSAHSNGWMSWIWGRACSLTGIALLFGQFMGFMALVPPLALFQGIDSAILSPPYLWFGAVAMFWGARAIWEDALTRPEIARFLSVLPCGRWCHSPKVSEWNEAEGKRSQ